MLLILILLNPKGIFHLYRFLFFEVTSYGQSLMHESPHKHGDFSWHLWTPDHLPAVNPQFSMKAPIHLIFVTLFSCGIIYDVLCYMQFIHSRLVNPWFKIMVLMPCWIPKAAVYIKRELDWIPYHILLERLFSILNQKVLHCWLGRFSLVPDLQVFWVDKLCPTKPYASFSYHNFAYKKFAMIVSHFAASCFVSLK